MKGKDEEHEEEGGDAEEVRTTEGESKGGAEGMSRLSEGKMEDRGAIVKGKDGADRMSRVDRWGR
jgi:hypothetical protein